MDKLADASQFLDLNSFAALRSKSQKEDPEALKQVAQQFEGIFVQMLMKSMRDANKVFEADSPLNSQYTQFYEQMHDQQMSLNLSSEGMLGLSDLMVQQLSPQTSQQLPASVLRADHNATNFTPHVSIQDNIAKQDPLSFKSHLLDPLTPNMLEKGQRKMALAQHLPVPNAITATNTVHNTALINAGINNGMNASLNESVNGSVEPSLETKEASAASQVSSPAAFVATLYPYAVEAAKRLGTQAEVLLAQSALETGWGQKIIQTQAGDTSHNLFNIKAGLSWQGQTAVVDTLEFEQGNQVKQPASFRVYDDIKHSFDDFVNVLTQQERYQAVMQNANTPQTFIQGLQDAGYATDPQYTHKIMRVLKSITQDLLPKAVLR
ncbi:flagellar assembly peptidoglycan hydrolase FlgJ [uncultured Shewanella sp.]|uniref:flagellar assembly peptidoglycan hydrolase FlgJ n=1 Tax=uncultured Shewanella sp. TaxID=173975 RepID=UPI00262BDAA6|nr:flagellar assembly peptidoglycan hydrolase FlgJ [uncultured Shewanella sp.]